jgi:hypothetical protein
MSANRPVVAPTGVQVGVSLKTVRYTFNSSETPATEPMQAGSFDSHYSTATLVDGSVMGFVRPSEAFFGHSAVLRGRFSWKRPQSSSQASVPPKVFEHPSRRRARHRAWAKISSRSPLSRRTYGGLQS